MTDEATKLSYEIAYKAGYKAAAEAMRERAAKECDFLVSLFYLYGVNKPHIISTIDAASDAIRALPVEE